MAASFLPSTAQAQSLLTPPATDQSVGVLNKLFGTSDWHSVYMHSLGFVGSGAVFFEMLKAFDAIVFGFVALVSGAGKPNTRPTCSRRATGFQTCSYG